MKKTNTIIIPIIQSAFLLKMLATLYEYTDPETFNVIVIDNTGDTKAQEACGQYVHMWIKPHRNLGFSKSMNTGIRLADTKYVTLANDDIEFMDKRWWQGIIDTFATDARIVAVNPMSPKEATWGYGHTGENHETWMPKDGFVPVDNKAGMVPVINGTPFPEHGPWTQTEYDLLLNNHPSWSPNTMCDAIAMWCTVFRTDDLIGKNPRVGLLDERFYPAAGEDYDMNARAYSCAWPKDRETCDPDYHYRMVGTSRSWVWHHWGKSLAKSQADPNAKLFEGRERWNYNERLWKPQLEVWGHIGEGNEKKPVRRDPVVFIDEL